MGCTLLKYFIILRITTNIEKLMTEEMKEKLGEILDSTIDPESGMSVSQMGLVKGIKYNSIAHKFFVYLNQFKLAKAQGLVFLFSGQKPIVDMLEEKIIKEFPGMSVQFINN